MEKQEHVSLRELYSEGVMDSLIDILDAISLKSFIHIYKDTIHKNSDFFNMFDTRYKTIIDILEGFMAYGASYMDKEVMRPLINICGGIHKFNKDLANFNMRYYLGKKDFILINEDLFPNEIEESIEVLLENGYIDILEQLPIDLVGWLDINRADVCHIMKECLGWTTLADFYLMRKDKGIYQDKHDKTKLDMHIQTVNRFKENLFNESNLYTGVRISEPNTLKDFEIKMIW